MNNYDYDDYDEYDEYDASPEEDELDEDAQLEIINKRRLWFYGQVY